VCFCSRRLRRRRLFLRQRVCSPNRRSKRDDRSRLSLTGWIRRSESRAYALANSRVGLAADPDSPVLRVIDTTAGASKIPFVGDCSVSLRHFFARKIEPGSGCGVPSGRGVLSAARRGKWGRVRLELPRCRIPAAGRGRARGRAGPLARAGFSCLVGDWAPEPQPLVQSHPSTPKASPLSWLP